MASCAGLIPAALEIGGNLLATAVGNSDQAYGDGVREMLALLTGAGGGRPAGTQGARPPATPSAGPAATPLVLEVALLRETGSDGSGAATPIADGDLLTFRPEGGSDRFKVFFRPGGRYFVYVILVDGTGWVQPLFPQSPEENPVEPGRGRFLPGGDLAFEVDEYRGVETIYFVASRERRADLEEAMERFAALTREEPDAALAVLEPPVIERGVAERRPGGQAVLTTRSGDATLATTTFLSDLLASDLVITRWFHHR
jgi:hypothetical protein